MPKKTKPKLNRRQTLFVKEYLVDLNATQAAIRAGYSKKAAGAVGDETLKNPEIAAAIKKAMDARAAKVDIKAEDVLLEVARIAFCDIREAFNDDGSLKDIKKLSDAVAKSVASVEVFEEFSGTGSDRVKIGETKKLKFWNKPQALELLGNHLGMFAKIMSHKIEKSLEELIAGSKDGAEKKP